MRLLLVEGALHLAGVPGGGFDLDAFEANKAIAVTEFTGTIGAGGTVDIAVTLTDTNAEGGLNHLMAVIEEADGRTSDLSNVVIAKLEPPSVLNASTTSIDFSHVTRSPLTKRDSMPCSFMPREIALPPPCTITGHIPTHSMNATSLRIPSECDFSSIALPPNFTTIVS